MNKTKRHLSEKNVLDILKKNETGLNFAKDRDETLSNYAPHSTTSYGFKKKSKFRLKEDDDWDMFKEKRAASNKPKLTRVVYRSNRPNDLLSNDIYRKHYDPIMTTTKYDTQTARNSHYPQQESQYQEIKGDKKNNEKTFYQTKSIDFSNQQEKQKLFNQNKTPNQFNRKNFNKSMSQLPKTFYSTKQLPNRYDQTQTGFQQYNKFLHDNQKRVRNKDFYNNNRNFDKEQQDSVNEQHELQKKVSQEDLDYLDRERNIDNDREHYDNYEDDAQEQAIFDQISNQDWYKLLPEEVLNNKNIDLDQFFIDNSEYFYNLLCQNAQMRSTKPFFFNNDYQTPKYKYNPAFNTTYNKQFFRKTQQFPSQPQITDKMMQTNFLGQQQIEYSSQKQRDYKDHGVREVERRVQDYQPVQKPFMGLTSYKSTFMDWKNYSQQPLKAPPHLSTVNDLPFFGKTSYEEAFAQNKYQKGDIAQIDRKKLFKGPIPTYPLFFGETHYANTFKPFQTKTISEQNNTPSHQIDKQQNDNMRNTFYSQIPSYQGQYKSVSKRDFGLQKDRRFLATQLKKIWRNKIQKKLEELKAIKDKKQQEELQIQIS